MHHNPDIVSVAYTGITPELIAFARLPPQVVSRDTLAADPFFTVLHRTPDYVIIYLPSGSIVSCSLTDLEAVRSEPLGREAMAFAPSPDTRFHRPPTPRFLPDSPPSQRDLGALQTTHPDITYDHAASTVFVHPPLGLYPSFFHTHTYTKTT